MITIKQSILISSIFVAAVAQEAKALSEAQVIKIAEEVSLETGVEVDLLVAIAKVESNFNPKAVGKTHGEVGLMQLRPKYFPTATFDPTQNMRLAAKYLAKLKKKGLSQTPYWYYKYNVGPGRTINNPKLFTYVQRVEYARQYYKAFVRFLVQD